MFDSIPLSMTFDQLFSDDRFAGLDRIGDADRLTVAVTSRVLSGSGKELGALQLAYLTTCLNREKGPGLPILAQAISWPVNKPST